MHIEELTLSINISVIAEISIFAKSESILKDCNIDYFDEFQITGKFLGKCFFEFPQKDY